MAGFRTLSALLSGGALVSPPEDDAPAASEGGKPAPTAAQIEAAVAADVAASNKEAAASATTAANVRWNTVMTSDAGKANPAAGARLLMAGGGNMTADEVIATLGDVAPTAPAAPSQQDNDRQQLANDTSTRPDTGAAGTGRGARAEGDDGSALKEHRKQRAEQRNRHAARNGGKQVGA